MLQKNTPKRLSQTGQSLIRLHTLGAAAGDVTGSLNLLELFQSDKVIRVLLDVGLNQENEGLNRPNRLPKGMKADEIDAVIISHAHIDHSGWLPALVKQGFTGPVYTHEATRDLLQFMLVDSGHLQEIAADRINQRLEREARRQDQSDDQDHVERKGDKRASRRRPVQEPKLVEPLYTEADAHACLPQINGVKYETWCTVADGLRFKLTEAGHILGAAVVTLELGKAGRKRSIVFSGNIGRPNRPFLNDLKPVLEADYLICEATYGNRRHEQRDRLTQLQNVINAAYARAQVKAGKQGYGSIIIPAFAVERTQAVVFDLSRLMEQGRIPKLAVFVDSPMANHATDVHRKHPELLNAACRKAMEAARDPFTTARHLEVTSVNQSQRLDQPCNEPIIIVSSSGMAAGGRVVQHLKNRLPGRNNTVVFVGYQAVGTLGRQLTDPTHKADAVKIFGELVPVNATIEYLPDYSGHADYEEILRWLKLFQRRPKQTFLVHGEQDAVEQLKKHIEGKLGWSVVLPQNRQCFELD